MAAGAGYTNLMTATNPTGQSGATAATQSGQSGNTGGRRSTSVSTYTETKAGPKTTEFMLSVVFAVAVIIASYLDGNDTLNRSDGWRYALIAIAAYAISRGLAKAGTREPYSDDR